MMVKLDYVARLKVITLKRSDKFRRGMFQLARGVVTCRCCASSFPEIFINLFGESLALRVIAAQEKKEIRVTETAKESA